MSSHSNKQRNIIPSLLLDKFILNDNNKIIKLARHLLSIYSRSIRKVKVKWLLMWKYKLHLYLSESYFEMKKKTNVHERLFNDYKYKEALMFNLMKHYDSIESEKYPFMPLINKCSFNFVNNITLPNKIEEKDYLECFKGKCSSDRKMHSKGKVIQYSQPNCVSSVKQNHIHIKSEQLSINNNTNNSITLKDQNYNNYYNKRNQSNSKHETFIDISRSYEPKTAKISSYHNNSQSKITINNNNDIVNDYYCSGNISNTNNNNNSNTSLNVNMFYKKNGLINGYYHNYNKKKAPKINLNSSSSTISLQSTQNKTKRHNNSTSSNTLLINTTTPTTSITKSKHPNNKHYIGKTLYNTIKDTNAFNTITHNNNSISNITANNNQQLFTNRLKNKTNLLTERTNAKTVHHDKIQPNGHIQDTTSKKSFINKYRKNTPLVTRSYTAGGIDEKRTSCYSQTNSTTNLEITINHKKDQSSKEIVFSNGNSNICNGSTFQNKNNQFIITNLKQQHYSGGYNYNYNYNYPYRHSNKMISPSEQITNKQEINNQCLFSIINKESNQYNNNNNKLKITNREVNENIDNGKNYIDNNVNNNMYDNNNTARNEVTLQSLSDSKMYEIANHYITTDESLDRYQCLSYTTSKRK